MKSVLITPLPVVRSKGSLRGNRNESSKREVKKVRKINMTFSQFEYEIPKRKKKLYRSKLTSAVERSKRYYEQQQVYKRDNAKWSSSNSLNQSVKYFKRTDPLELRTFLEQTPGISNKRNKYQEADVKHKTTTGPKDPMNYFNFELTSPFSRSSSGKLEEYPSGQQNNRVDIVRKNTQDFYEKFRNKQKSRPGSPSNTLGYLFRQDFNKHRRAKSGNGNQEHRKSNCTSPRARSANGLPAYVQTPTPPLVKLSDDIPPKMEDIKEEREVIENTEIRPRESLLHFRHKSTKEIHEDFLIDRFLSSKPSQRREDVGNSTLYRPMGNERKRETSLIKKKVQPVPLKCANVMFNPNDNDAMFYFNNNSSSHMHQTAIQNPGIRFDHEYYNIDPGKRNTSTTTNTTSTYAGNRNENGSVQKSSYGAVKRRKQGVFEVTKAPKRDTRSVYSVSARKRMNAFDVNTKFDMTKKLASLKRLSKATTNNNNGNSGSHKTSKPEKKNSNGRRSRSGNRKNRKRYTVTGAELPFLVHLKNKRPYVPDHLKIGIRMKSPIKRWDNKSSMDAMFFDDMTIENFHDTNELNFDRDSDEESDEDDVADFE